MRCLEGSSAPTARLAAQMEDEMTAFLESKSFAALPEYARDLLIMDMREVFWEEIAAHWIRAAKETRDR
jgi:hypothetical protein